MLRKMSACAAALTLAWCATASVAQAQERTNGVLVKLRAEASQKALSNADHARTLSAAANAPVRVQSGPAPDMRLVKSADASVSDAALAEALQNAGDVELAVPNRFKRLHATPNDPLFTEQWYLLANDYAAVRAQGAWDLTTGSHTVPVAVIDSGVRLDHPDLTPNLLPGYNFVDMNSDASDPGYDQPLMNECNDGFPWVLWHGTKVSGLIAAAGNNAQGITGLNWNGRIVPVRVTSACGRGNAGAWDSDIIGGIRWAAGLPIDGVPANPNPARVINASLGGDALCTPEESLYSYLASELAARSVILVASAGNESTAVSNPANCPGVIGVGSVTPEGHKSDYSNFGPEVLISAPGGEHCDDSFPCKSLITTTNFGIYAPQDNGYSSLYVRGTSFSAPLVSGAIALMLSVNPSLTLDDVKYILSATARPFPQNAALPVCGGTNTKECNCTADTCGAGILDVEAAVRFAKDYVAPLPMPVPDNGGGGAADWLALFGLLGLAAGKRRLRKA